MEIVHNATLTECVSSEIMKYPCTCTSWTSCEQNKKKTAKKKKRKENENKKRNKCKKQIKFLTNKVFF